MSGTDLQTLLNQAMGQLESIGNSSSSSSTATKDTFINSIYTVGNEAEGLISGNGEEKTTAVTNIIENILGLISAAKNQVSNANKETKKDADDINKNQESAETTSNQVEENIKNITSNITTHTETIKNALKELNSLGEDNGDIAKVQEEINEQLKIIEKEKENLKSSDPEKRNQALENINSAAEIINSLVGTISSMKEDIKEQEEVVNTSVENIANLIENSATIITNGISKIQGNIQKSTNLETNIKSITAQGAMDNITGSTLTKVGEGLSSNAFTAAFSGGKGTEMILAGNQYSTAGSIKIGNGAQNMHYLFSSFKEIGSMMNTISGYTVGIGQLGAESTTLATQFTETSQPYIQAIGSMDVDALKEANSELQNQVKNADQIMQDETDKKVNLATSKKFPTFGV